MPEKSRVVARGLTRTGRRRGRSRGGRIVRGAVVRGSNRSGHRHRSRDGRDGAGGDTANCRTSGARTSTATTSRTALSLRKSVTGERQRNQSSSENLLHVRNPLVKHFIESTSNDTRLFEQIVIANATAFTAPLREAKQSKIFFIII